MTGCGASDDLPPPGDPVVGALEVGPLADCSGSQLEEIIAQYQAEGAGERDGLELCLELFGSGVSPAVLSLASFHAGLRGLSPGPGNIQHLTAAAVTSAMVGAADGGVDSVVAAAWTGDRVVRTLRSHEGLPAIGDPVLATGDAQPDFDAGVAAGDPQQAMHAIVALYRDRGLEAATDALVRWAPRYNGNVGHPTIFMQFVLRALQWCPDVNLEPGLQQIAHGLSDFDPALTQALFETEELARGLDVDDDADVLDSDAVVEILAQARVADSQTMRQTAAELLEAGVGVTSIFTGTTLATVELMHRYRAEAVGNGLHSFDSIHALHNSWKLARDPLVRMTLSLASCSWLPPLRDLAIAASPDAEAIWEMDIDRLAPDGGASKLDAALDMAVSDPQRGAAQILGLFDHPSRAGDFQGRLRDLVLQKSQQDPHEYKLPLALLEQMWAIDPAWRGRLATAAAAFGPTPSDADGIAFLRVRHELEG